MTRLPAPQRVAKVIAERAAQHCREDIEHRGWHSSGAIQPVYADGQVGLTSTVKYLLYQNKGFDPFVMLRKYNGVLPLACAQGDGPHYRFYRIDHAGTPGEVDIPHRGKTWRTQRWRHPGLKPKRFMEASIRKAIKESRNEIKGEVMKALKGEK